MRIWDINPGYLNRQSLLGEHRELHAIVSIIKHGKKGYSRHPETLRWQGFGWALAQRHRLLVAEMNLRSYKDHTPVKLKTQNQTWPQVFVDPPAAQFSILAGKYKRREQGRISLPQSVQQLWAQHQYSVMARDKAEYKYLMGWVTSRKSGTGISDIYPHLIILLRCPPVRENLKETLWLMWNTLRLHLPFSGSFITPQGGQGLLKTIQRLSFSHDIAFLKESTVLGELDAWTSFV